MALKIIASMCTGCSACEPECPNVAIREKGGTFIIDPNKCTECVGHYDEPQCVQVCPVDCIPKDENHVETSDMLWVKYEKLTGNKRA